MPRTIRFPTQAREDEEPELGDTADLELEDTSMLAEDEVFEVVLHLEVGDRARRDSPDDEEELEIEEEELDVDDLVAVDDN